ncbi:MAG: hypothetical protein DRN15_03900 [Thermoprotei archaeon]|nr:MAG: hypothetical protein DRN15_03900 [Thermoprotei archaeon]
MSELLRRIPRRTGHPYLVYDSITMTRAILDEILKEKSYIIPIQEAAKEIVKRSLSKIYFTGCGTSFYAGIVATYAFHKIARVPSEAVTAFEVYNYPPPDLGNSCLVLISHSGHTKVDIDLAGLAKKMGAYTIAITDVPDSPLARSVDKVVSGPGGRDPAIPKTRSYIASLLRCILLALYVGDEKGYDVSEYLAQVKRIPDLISSTLKATEEKAREIARKYKDKFDFFVVGGGPNYATALEGALKLKEMSYINAEAIEAEEAAHGPWLCFNENMVFITIAPPGPSYERLHSLVRGVKAIGVSTISIVREGDERISKDSDDVIEIKENLSEDLTPLVYIMPLYLVSYYLAVEKGVNPDIARSDDERFRKAFEIIFPPGTH